MRAFPLLLLFAAGAAQAAPIEPLKPLSFLAGYCWKGSVPASTATDEHCFEWVLDGKALRDTHVVRSNGKPDYKGETTYYWSPIGKTVEYLYIESTGGMSRGTMETVANTLAYPPAEQMNSDAKTAHRVRWSPQGTNAFDTWAEKLGPDGSWQTIFKMTMTKTRPAGARTVTTTTKKTTTKKTTTRKTKKKPAN